MKPKYEPKPLIRLSLEGLFGVWLVAAVARLICIAILLSLTTPQSTSPKVRSRRQPSLATGIVVAPLVEEVATRSPLRVSPARLGIPSAILLFLALPFSVSIRLGIGICGGLVAWFLTKQFHAAIERFYTKNFRWIFYGLALIFGWFHVSQRDLADPNAIAVCTVVALTHAFSGLALGYIRTQNGLAASITVHALNNGLAWTMS